MKVCLMNDSFPPVIDGVVNVMLNYAAHLQEDHDTQIMVGTPNYPDADYDKYPYPIVPYPSFDTAARASGYRTGNPFWEKAVSELAGFQPDLIHTHCPATATIMARLVRERTGAPIVFTYHTKYEIDIARMVKIKAIAQEGIRGLVNNVEACDEVWTVSRGAGESLKALGYQGDYRVMNNGVDFARGRVDALTVASVTSEYDLPAGVPVYLFVGRLMTYKGLPLILDALKLVAEQGKDFRMVFIGKGPDRELLETKAEELRIRDKCIFVGPIYDREKLRAWNTRADLFLFPSTFDTNGLVVREAAACGLASVLIRNSCASEGITDGRNGFVVEETAESMAELLLRVSGDLGHLRKVGLRAMDEIYISWKDAVDEAYERYQIILEKKQAGLLPERKKLLSDVMIQGVAKTMEEQTKIRRMRQDLFADFKEGAVGMMENFQETGENMKAELVEARDKVKSDMSEARSKTRQKILDAKAEWKQVSEDTDRFYQVMRDENLPK